MIDLPPGPALVAAVVVAWAAVLPVYANCSFSPSATAMSEQDIVRFLRLKTIRFEAPDTNAKGRDTYWVQYQRGSFAETCVRGFRANGTWAAASSFLKHRFYGQEEAGEVRWNNATESVEFCVQRSIGFELDIGRVSRESLNSLQDCVASP